METKLPAIQAEQAEDDVAPVTAEYVPAKTRDECTGKPIGRRKPLLRTGWGKVVGERRGKVWRKQRRRRKKRYEVKIEICA